MYVLPHDCLDNLYGKVSSDDEDGGRGGRESTVSAALLALCVRPLPSLAVDPFGPPGGIEREREGGGEKR